VVSAVEWVCRHAGGCLIDTPDLPALPDGPAWRWTATLWVDPYTACGWSRLVWMPGERGWQLPATLAIGDVLEFGAWRLDRHGRATSAKPACWFGWLDYATDYALIIHGPFHHPAAAAVAARPVVDELRLRQLSPPSEPLVELLRP
jgi:hypothetical protein